MTAGDDVDALAAAGDLGAAADLLQSRLTPASPAPAWLKLAGLRRALRQPRRALDAVHGALATAPLDFVALAMRASLLEQLQPAQAGEAWAEALAQQPSTPLPPPLVEAVARGEALRDRWIAEREQRLAAAMAPHEAEAGDDAAWRLARFRSNTLRRTRTWHSEPTHFAYPGLAEREFHPRARFPWLAALEEGFEAIRAEMLAVIANDRAELVPYIDYQAHEALAQWQPLNRNRDWTAAHLVRNGQRIAANADRCPSTMALLAQIPQPEIRGAGPNAMFSLLAPRTTIPPHVGVNNARLVCHLPLVIPPGGCWFRVGAETRAWQEGQAFVFDDTIEHEAQNPTDHLRVVLIFDVWHPDLSAAERAGVSAAIGSEGAGADGAL